MTARRVVPAAVAASLALVALTPSVAQADDPFLATAVSSTVYPLAGAVVLDTGLGGHAQVDASCVSPDPASPVTARLQVWLSRYGLNSPTDEPDYLAYGQADVLCSGERVSSTVALNLLRGVLVDGEGTVDGRLVVGSLYPGGLTDPVPQAVRVVQADPPVPETKPWLSFLKIDVGPEPGRKNKTLSVNGSVRVRTSDDGPVVWKAGQRAVDLLFSPDGKTYTKVKILKSDHKGRLSTKVKAKSSGEWTFAYAGTADVEPGTARADHVDVLPVARHYTSCTALRKVYPHGVAKEGAVDKGGSVVDFIVDGVTYSKNRTADSDKDGIACEA